MCRQGFLVGGFASVKYYYWPMRLWLAREGFDVKFIHPGPFGFNVWPLETFLKNAIPAIEAAPEPVFLIGHSLGGIQALLLADLFPEKVRKVFAIGTPVWGCSLKMYEDAIISMLNATPEDFERFRREVVPRNAKKTVTISCEDDVLAPKDKCVIEGASNYVVVAADEGVSSSHLLLPYLSTTIKVIAEETRALPSLASPVLA